MLSKFNNPHTSPNILTFSGCILGSVSHTKHRTINKRGLIALIGYGWGVGLSLLMFATFLHAYFGNNYRFAIDINSFGEAHIELCSINNSNKARR